MRNLDMMYRSGELHAMANLAPRESESIEGPSISEPLSIPFRDIPLINLVSAGEPGAFTDLGYPARIADHYIRTIDPSDPDAFAARISGDSMEPDYRDGDVLVFSPGRPAKSGADCFVRFETSAEVTFKRVFLEHDDDGRELIRLQPLNHRYRARRLPREAVAMLCPVVQMVRGY